MSQELHYVKVTPGQIWQGDEQAPAELTFECRGNQDSKCRQYPDCDCNEWSADHPHPLAPHDDCWLKDWFEAGGVTYTGNDADDMRDDGLPKDMDREGFITPSWEFEYVTWDWA